MLGKSGLQTKDRGPRVWLETRCVYALWSFGFWYADPVKVALSNKLTARKFPLKAHMHMQSLYDTAVVPGRP